MGHYDSVIEAEEEKEELRRVAALKVLILDHPDKVVRLIDQASLLVKYVTTSQQHTHVFKTSRQVSETLSSIRYPS